MVTTHNLGFPRIGAHRELKFALENYWAGNSGETELDATAATLRHRHWRQQSHLDLIPVGDFSLYDQVLDMSATLGNLPERARGNEANPLDDYFRAARGRSPGDADCLAKHVRVESTKETRLLVAHEGRVFCPLYSRLDQRIIKHQ